VTVSPQVVGRGAERVRALAMIAILAGFCILFWPSLPVPFERDEGEYAHAADLLAGGGVPYRDAFLQKPPAIVLVYRAVFLTLGPSFASMHFAVLVSYLLTLVLIARLGRHLADPPTGLLAAAVLALALTMPAYETYPANTEAFMILPTVAAMLGLQRLRERPAARTAAWAGSCFAAAVLFKPVAIFHGPHLALGVLITARGRRQRLARLMLFCGFALLPGLACIGWLAARGALPGFVDAVVLHNLEYVATHPEGTFGQLLLRRVSAFSVFDGLLWSSAAIAVVALALRRERWLSFIIGGWLAAAILGVSATGYFRGHYWIQALPPLALATALGARWLDRRTRMALLAILLVAWVSARPWLFGMTVEQQALRRYGYLRFVSSVDIGDYLRREGAGSLFVLASEPQLYHYCRCRSVTRMVLMNPLFGGYPSSRRRQQETLAEIRRDLPDFIVVSLPGLGVPTFPNSDRWFYERAAELIRERYSLVGLTLVRRRGVHDPARIDPGSRPDLLIFRRAGALRPGSVSPG
jgi:4-amino-4-deoxy-L-arabinose transferase-like glycosyltransferase